MSQPGLRSRCSLLILHTLEESLKAPRTAGQDALAPRGAEVATAPPIPHKSASGCSDEPFLADNICFFSRDVQFSSVFRPPIPHARTDPQSPRPISRERMGPLATWTSILHLANSVAKGGRRHRHSVARLDAADSSVSNKKG